MGRFSGRRYAELSTTPGALAARTGLSSGGAITALIDRLERAGYGTRRRDAATAANRAEIDRLRPAPDYPARDR